VLGPQSFASATTELRRDEELGGARCAPAPTPHEAECRLAEAHTAMSRPICRAVLRGWRSHVLRRQDRQSVVHYCETLYQLNLIRRALYAFISSFGTPCTEHVACQTTPPHTPETSAAPPHRHAHAQRLALAGSDAERERAARLSAISLPSANSETSNPMRSPNARAKAAVKNTIQFTRVGPDSRRAHARGRAREQLTEGDTAGKNGGSGSGVAAGRESNIHKKKSSRWSRVAPVPVFRKAGRTSEIPRSTQHSNEKITADANVQKNDSAPCVLRGGTGIAASGVLFERGGETIKVGEGGRQSVERTLRREGKREERRGQRENLWSKAEVMEAKLMREILALDAQVRRIGLDRVSLLQVFFFYVSCLTRALWTHADARDVGPGCTDPSALCVYIYVFTSMYTYVYEYIYIYICVYVYI